MAWYNTVRKTVASKLSSPVGGAVKLAGGISSLAGAKGTGQKLSNIGGAIQNPNLNYTGTFSPSGLMQAYTSPSGQFVAANKQTSAGGGGGDGSVETVNQFANTGGGGGSAAANPYAEAYTGQRQDARNRLQAILAGYDALTGQAQNLFSDKAKQLRESYGNQRQKLGDTYQQNANQTAGAYMARGLGDSSFAANAQDINTKNYNTGIADIANNENQSLSDLGAKFQTARSQYESAKNIYQNYLNNLGNYGGQDLANIINQADTGLGSIAQAQAGQGTQAQNLQAIQSIAPAQLNPSALQTQLQNIQNSGAADFVKNTIAKGLITSAVGDNPDQQSYWSDYFRSLGTTGKA